MNEHLLAERTRVMGQELGTFFHHLEQEVETLSIKWCEFYTLYNDDNVDQLNASAATFFYMVNQLMFHDAMMTLSRLTDPPKQFGHENLSIRRLQQLVGDDQLRARLEFAIVRATRACAFARAWRDKRLAHGNVDIITGRQAISHPDVGGANVSKAIRAIGRVLRLVARWYRVFSQSSTRQRPNPWGAEALVDRLRK